jgi:hypothetical protein
MLVSLIPLWRQMYSVGVLGPFTSRVYVTYHFRTPICNVLGYWRHRSVCYTSLFTTSLVVTTNSVYNVLGPSDVVSRSGSGSSLDLFGDLSSISLMCLSSVPLFSVCFLSVSLLCSLSVSLSRCLSPLKSSVYAWDRRHLPHKVCISRCSGFPAIWFLRNS